jgi:hypothetical protein
MQLYTQNLAKNSAQAQPGLQGDKTSLKTNGAVIGLPGKATIARMDDAEYLPTTTKVASSVNTASSIAGLKPWDQNWVFEGNPKPSEDIRPLFGASDSEVGFAEARDALKQLGLMAALAADGTQKNPGAAQVSDNLRTRSDADIAQLQAMQANNVADPNGLGGKQIMNAQGVAAGAQMNPLLRSQLQEMNGNMTLKGGKPVLNAQNVGQQSGAAGLSGAEFMRTLSMVRPNGAQNGQEFTQSQDFAGGGGSRPELTLIEGAKGGKSNPNEDLVLSSAPGSYSGLHSLTQSQPQQVSTAPTVVTGHVVPGSMAQDQLSHEAILGMSTGIRDLSAQGGGEMRIRLKPENLGELHLRVVTQGNEVGLSIHATDDKAKRILQDSIGGLKDSLAAQNLTLGKVEFSVAQASGGHSMHHESRDGSGQQQASAQQQFNQTLGQNAGDGRNQRSALWNDQDGGGSGAKPLKSGGQFGSSSGGSSANAPRTDGRLDVLA